MPWTTVGLCAGAIVLAGVVVLGLFRVFSPGPGTLGVSDGRLHPCPSSPNCVCSQDTAPGHAIEPIVYSGSAAAAWSRLKKVLGGLARVRIVSEDQNYLHAEFTSLLFRYVDDVEFLIDADKRVIHLRSASRAGHSDLGVNRKRMEAVRGAFNRMALE